MLLFWWLWVALAVKCSGNEIVPLDKQWCPPANLKRHSGPGLFRTTVMTEIHGQIERTGLNWGIFLAGPSLSRFFYYYLGVLGFNNIYLNILYNDTIHVTPPTLEELYPAATSCVASWARTGRITLKHITYAGPKSRWPLDPYGKQTIKKNAYRTTRGINPTFNDIKKNNRSDWVMVIDVDELLIPLNWKPPSDQWCQTSPSLIQQGIVSMLTVGQTRHLDGYDNMTLYQNKMSPGCPYGQSYRTWVYEPFEYFVGFPGPSQCVPVDGIVFPTRFWSPEVLKPSGVFLHDDLPSLRSKFIVAYGKTKYLNRTQDEYGHAQNWKTMHKVATCPYLNGPRTAHDGLGFSLWAPRLYHTTELTFEVAHFRSLREEDESDLFPLMIRDRSIVELMESYEGCMKK